MKGILPAPESVPGFFRVFFVSNGLDEGRCREFVWGLVCLVVLSLCAGPARTAVSPAGAADSSPIDPWYLTIAGGGFAATPVDEQRASVGEVQFGPGQALSLRVGSGLAGPWISRWDVEALIRKRNVETVRLTGGGSARGLGDWRSSFLVINGYHDFGEKGWRPYLGAGLGGARLEARYNASTGSVGATTDVDYVPAYQAGLGLRKAIGDHLLLDAGYRLTATGSPKFTEDGGGQTYTTDGLLDHQVELGVEWQLFESMTLEEEEPVFLPTPERYWSLGVSGVASPEMTESRSSVRTLQFDEGVKVLGSVGFELPYWFVSRWELEGSYRDLDVQTVNLSSGTASPGSGEWRMWSAMVNGYHDFRDTGWRPYVGLGLGTAYLDVEYRAAVTPPREVRSEDLLPAYQGMLGVRKKITSTTLFQFGYRITGTTTPQFEDEAGESFTTDYVEDHQVELGLQVGF